MVDNFELISSLLKWETEDEFYFLPLLKRKKEHPELGSNSQVIKTYYIRSLEHLNKLKDEIIVLSTHHNARACINLNRRSFEKCAFQMLLKVTGQIMNKDYKSVKQAYDSVCGANSNEKEKKWIIDIDNKDFDEDFLLSLLIDIEPMGEKFIAKIPTKNGYHLITKPFNRHLFSSLYKGEPIDVHCDNPTILFIP